MIGNKMKSEFRLSWKKIKTEDAGWEDPELDTMLDAYNAHAKIIYDECRIIRKQLKQQGKTDLIREIDEIMKKCKKRGKYI